MEQTAANMIDYKKEGRIARITLQRPEALNALDDQMNADLEQVWLDFQNDPDLDVALLFGNGKAFCVGADIKTFIPKWEHANLMSPRKNAVMGIGGGITRGHHRLFKPIIAAIDGPALGGGFELALACDIRLASERATFGSVEAKLGIHSGDGGLVRLTAIAGIAVALELAMTARTFSAEEALRLGIVNKVVKPEELEDTAEAFAKMIVANGQEAVRSAKETILDLIGRPLDDALRLEAINAYSAIGDYEEVGTRIQALMERKN